MKGIVGVLIVVFAFFACNKAKSTSSTKKEESYTLTVPIFSADSAYYYIEKQVNFGVRTPNTSGHKLCAEYLVKTLENFGAEVIEQKMQLEAFDGTVLNATNIIASFEPEKKNRILLFAHWDTRPWADNDAKPENREKPILGANDGASGVGVLLEIARQLGRQAPKIGVDIIFFDAEDYGAPRHLDYPYSDKSWCLGSQYWAKNMHKPNYRPKYGILVDMVGAPGATFFREYFSEQYAPHIIDKVWGYAKNLGFEHYFINKRGGGVTDDHVFVNQIAGIPSIDIIQYDLGSNTGFGHYWHTLNDDMENIDKSTLQAVGTTLLYVIYNE